MKRIVLMLVAIVSVSLALLADRYAQCKIAGGNGSTASVSLGDYNEDAKTVTVYFSNDSDKPTTICCKVICFNQEVGTCMMVPPASEVTKEVRVPSKPTGIEVSSARCASK